MYSKSMAFTCTEFSHTGSQFLCLPRRGWVWELDRWVFHPANLNLIEAAGAWQIEMPNMAFVEQSLPLSELQVEEQLLQGHSFFLGVGPAESDFYK